MCPVNQRLPRPYWINDFIVANEVYRLTTAMSGCDFNGYPTLTLLDCVLKLMDYEVENSEDFLEYIGALHSWHIRTISEKRMA